MISPPGPRITEVTELKAVPWIPAHGSGRFLRLAVQSLLRSVSAPSFQPGGGATPDHDGRPAALERRHGADRRDGGMDLWRPTGLPCQLVGHDWARTGPGGARDKSAKPAIFGVTRRSGIAVRSKSPGRPGSFIQPAQFPGHGAASVLVRWRASGRLTSTSPWRANEFKRTSSLEHCALYPNASRPERSPGSGPRCLQRGNQMTVGSFPAGSKSGPNIAFIQVDQLAARFLPHRRGTACRAANPGRLAGKGAVVETAHCNSRPCPPSRASTATGNPCSESVARDNAAELAAAIPAHVRHERRAGSRIAHTGRTRFIGPDRHHGFGRRPAPDLTPADFSWAPNWCDEGKQGANDPRSVTMAGIRERSMWIGLGEGPGSDAVSHRVETFWKDLAPWHLQIVADGCLRMHAGSVPESFAHAPSAGAPSDDS